MNLEANCCYCNIVRIIHHVTAAQSIPTDFLPDSLYFWQCVALLTVSLSLSFFKPLVFLLGKRLILKRSICSATALSILYMGLHKIVNNFILNERIGEEASETFGTPVLLHTLYISPPTRLFRHFNSEGVGMYRNVGNFH